MRKFTYFLNLRLNQREDYIEKRDLSFVNFDRNLIQTNYELNKYLITNLTFRFSPSKHLSARGDSHYFFGKKLFDRSIIKSFIYSKNKLKLYENFNLNDGLTIEFDNIHRKNWSSSLIFYFMFYLSNN